jgi:hypothetical protein
MKKFLLCSFASAALTGPAFAVTHTGLWLFDHPGCRRV